MRAVCLVLGATLLAGCGGHFVLLTPSPDPGASSAPSSAAQATPPAGFLEAFCPAIVEVTALKQKFDAVADAGAASDRQTMNGAAAELADSAQNSLAALNAIPRWNPVYVYVGSVQALVEALSRLADKASAWAKRGSDNRFNAMMSELDDLNTAIDHEEQVRAGTPLLTGLCADTQWAW